MPQGKEQTNSYDQLELDDTLRSQSLVGTNFNLDMMLGLGGD